MSKFDERVDKYIAAYKDKIGGSLDEELLRKVTKGLGPSIYNKDAETVSAETTEMERVVNNYLVKKLGMTKSDKLMSSVEAVIEKYGKSERAKYRAIVYYMLCKHHKKESVYA